MFLLAGMLLAFQLLGCEGVEPPPVREYADVTGKITYRGKPVESGEVRFQPSVGAMVSGDIQPDGTYSLKGVIGPNSVMIVSQEAAVTMDANNPKTRQLPKSHIPAIYSTPGGELTFEVKSGANTADFDLK
jgi:hypothetical protein